MERILRLPEVKATAGVSGATIYRWIKEGHFPGPIKLSAHSNSSGWLRSDIERWLAERVNASVRKGA